MYKSQNYKEIENIKYKPRQKRNNSKMKTIKKRVIPKKNKDYQAIKTVKAVRQNYDKDDTEDN
jgi:hypothetical protein